MKQCPKCGYSNGDNTEFCEKCGQKITHEKLDFSEVCDFLRGAVSELFDNRTKRDQSATFNGTAQPSEAYSQGGAGGSGDDFISADETVQVTIGVSYLKSFMSGSGFKNGAAILTDKRLYYFGKSYSNVGRGANTTTEEGIVSIDEITFTRFVHGSPIGYLIKAAICFFPGVMLFGSSFGSTDSVAGIFGMTGLILALLGFLSLIAYFVRRNTIMEIAFPGGKYCFDSRWHSVSSMREFQRQIHLLKDGLKAGQRNEKQKDAEVSK